MILLKLILLLALYPVTGQAQNNGQWEQTHFFEQVIEKRITPLVKKIDHESTVIIKSINVKKKANTSTNTPLHPFDFAALSTQSNRPEEFLPSGLEILIYTRFPDRFSQDKKKQITDLIADKNIPIKFKVELNQEPVSVFDPETEAQKKQEMSERWWSGPGLIISILLGCALLGLALWSSGRGIQKTLIDSTNKLNPSNEKNHLSQEKEQPEPDARAQDKVSSKTSTDEAQINRLNEKGLTLSEAGLKALFADCYWCEKDHTAKFYWNIATLEQQTMLLSSLPFLEDYLKFIEEVSPEEAQIHLDISYINPLPLELINNHDLAEWARDHASILWKISQIRLAHLPLKAIEKLSLWAMGERQKNKGVELTLPQQPSPWRTFRRLPVMELHSEDEELALLNENIDDPMIMAGLPSLIWSSKLDQKDLADLFRQWNAKDLAKAWCGPAQTLEHLKKAIPPKKWMLIEEYLLQTPANRKGPEYKKLCRNIVDIVAKQSNNTIKTNPRVAA